MAICLSVGVAFRQQDASQHEKTLQTNSAAVPVDGGLSIGQPRRQADACWTEWVQDDSA